MPVLVGTQIAPSPTVETLGTVVTPPGAYQATWYAPDGVTVVDLTSPGSDFFSLKTITGLGATPVDHMTVDNPAGGVIVEGSRSLDRTILWPVRWRSTTHAGLIPPWRAAVWAFTQTRELGPGRLRITREDGTSREILAYYAGGLDGEPEDGVWLQFTGTIAFLCPDGFWYSPDSMVYEFREASGVDYLDPYPSISDGQVLGDVQLRNDGDRAAWPEWTIRGPLTSLTAENSTRGETFTFTSTLLTGETATITSRPIQVRSGAGANLVAALGLTTGGGKPWRLDPRTVSDVTFTAAGAAADSAPGADDGTRVWITYRTDHETA